MRRFAATETKGVSSLGRVLVVEDDDDIRKVYALWLEESGFEVIEARNGAEGVLRAVDQQPEAVLMDVAMPHMDGVEATRRLRSDPATAQMPILILSAYATQPDRERALAAGADEFLVKPCDLELVASRLRHYVVEGR
jgi:CheY-like chemotaxis protein